MSSTKPEYPTKITLKTLPQLLAAHRAHFGGMTMTQALPDPAGPPADPQQQAPSDPPQPPQRPDGVTEEEWSTLGDPGQRAILRERERTQAAERALAAARARPAPPKTQQTPPAQQQPQQPDPEGGTPDIAKIIQDAVAQAVRPFQDRDEQRDAEQAVQKIQTTVLDSAKDTFLDPTDALANIDLTQVTDGNGGVDDEKVKTALADLLTRKPHLGRTPDGRRYAPPGSPAGAQQSTAPLEAQVQSTLQRMQASAGIRPATS
jgi:hypothetical protein